MNQQPADERPAPPAPNDAARRDTAHALPAAGHSSGDSHKGRHRSGRLGLGVGALAAVALAGAFVAATLPRLRQERDLRAAAARLAEEPPRVSVAAARRAPPTYELTLPANAQPFCGNPLYARVNGYLTRWLVDIGDRVKEGQLVAEISTPDVDDQLAQARANLVLAQANLHVAEANLELAKITLDRDVKAGVGTATALQTIDQDRAQVKTTAAQVESAKANIEANRATVRQYADLQAFQKIIAPFPGVITARTVDPGALVTADNPSESRPLFYLMQTDPLRIYVNVPQVYSTTIAVGQDTDIYREEDPRHLFSAKVTRTAKALDPNTRTLLTEIDLPNPRDELRPGMYLQVKFNVARSANVVLVPSAALVWRPDTTVVAVLDGDHKVRYHKVQTGRDLGLEVEILSGLEGGETVVVHPGDALAEGQQVETVGGKVDAER
jgi:RND family efflux transporter MFP subunit